MPIRIDTKLEPWINSLKESLLQLFPLPPGLEVVPDGIPDPRVKILEAVTSSFPSEDQPTKGYFTATVASNTRITAADWYQDVRHFELDFEEDLQ